MATGLASDDLRGRCAGYRFGNAIVTGSIVFARLVDLFNTSRGLLLTLGRPGRRRR